MKTVDVCLTITATVVFWLAIKCNVTSLCHCICGITRITLSKHYTVSNKSVLLTCKGLLELEKDLLTHVATLCSMLC